MVVALYTHPDCELHEMPGHPERPDRLRSVMDRLHRSGTAADTNLILAEEISLADIELVHPANHVEAIASSEPIETLIKVDPDTYMSPGSLRASRLAAGACLSATKDVLQAKAKKAFCAIRPPGHHAEIATAMGFCLFNNVAIAAQWALTQPGIERVAIVDFDVHHCNGTVDIFKDMPEVLVCSSFQNHFYPHRYLDFSNEHILTLPLPAGSDGGPFRRGVESHWLPAIDQHQPDLILVSAGFDAHLADPLGQLQFNESDYRWITSMLCRAADQHCNGRLVSTLEGGYDLESLASSVDVHLAEMITLS
jgi:acetoin utilization deacetylase AcuC-like enzyme